MKMLLNRVLRRIDVRSTSQRSVRTTPRRRRLGLQNRLFLEALERRHLLATLYVDNPGDFIITNDQGAGGLDSGDTVTWNPGAGSQHGASVPGLIFGTDAFATIQSAVNAAAATDEIRVGPGTFSELVTVNTQVSLLGNQVGNDARTRTGTPETIVNGIDLGGGIRSTSFNVTTDDVVLDGFTVQEAGSSTQFGFGIALGAGTAGSEVRNNIVQDNIAGLSLANASAGSQTVIERNLFRNNNRPGPVSGTGIYTDQFNGGGTVLNVLIDNNTFIGHADSGIGFSSTSAAAPATNITVSNNLFDGNARALYAFSLTMSEITSNTIQNSTDTLTADLRFFEGVNGVNITRNVLQNGVGRALRVNNIGTGLPDATNITFQLNSVTGYTDPAGIFQVDTGGYAGNLDATCNWWGSITGPTIATNPGGTGQTISDPDDAVDFQPWLVYLPDASAATPGVQFVTSFSVPAQTSGFTSTNNNYRRLANAIDCLQDGQTVTLSGTFDWTETNAAASWALGNDGINGTADDFSLLVTPNINDITITAASLGSARIQGPGDVATANLEGVFVFDGGDNQNWTFSNLEIFDFDLSIGMFNGAGGADAYNDTTITNNRLRVPADLNATVAPADVNQNIGIHFSFGVNQTISNNQIELVGTGVSDSGANRLSSTVGMQSNTSGGSVYDGLQISGNVLTITGAQAADPASILGIWENASGHTSDITVSNNQVLNQTTGSTPATNRISAFRVTSHSSATTTVAYTGNTVTGANIGFQWLAGQNFAGNQAVRIWQNTLINNDTAVLIQSNGIANVFQNTITGSGAAAVNLVTGSLDDSGPVIGAVQENFITGGASHGIIVALGADVSGGIFNNDLSGNAGLAVNNLSLAVVNASGNWWGTNTAAGVAGEVSTNVDYSPWLDVGTDTSATTGFQGNFSTLHVDDTSPQFGSSGPIQEGIALATGATPTVIIETGTYPESVAANKAGLTLDGATGVATDVVIDPAAGNGITISTNGVTVRDLRVTGAVDGISASAVSGPTLTNVQSDTNTGRGVFLSNATGTTSLTNVTSTGNAADGLVVNGAQTLNVTGGSFSSNSSDGIALDNVTTATISGVTASGNTSVVADGLEAANVTTLVVTGGDFSGNADEGIDLLLGIATGTISGASLTNNGGLGLAVGQSGGGNTTLNLSDLTITGNVGGGGSINNVTTLNFRGTTGNVVDAIAISGTSLQHTRDPSGTNVVNQQLALANVTNLNASGDGGSDTFNVTPAASMTIAVDGDLPTPPASPGDTLNVNTAGTANPTLTSTSTPSGLQGSYTFGDRQPVNFQEIETLGTAADLAVTKDDSPEEVLAGENLTYTITVTNAGTLDALNVTLTDAIPASTTFVSFTAPAGWTAMTPAVGGTGTVTATNPNFAASAVATFVLVVNVDSSTSEGVILNTATVTTTTGEGNLANNSDTETTSLESLGLPECEVTTLNAPGAPGTATLDDDADNPGSGVLIVTGTTGNDVIVIEPRARNAAQLRVTRNGQLVGLFTRSDVQHIVAFGLEGNDKIVVNGSLSVPATLFGDEGNDQLFAARGADGLEGGSGVDRLFGGSNNDTLCGGDGNDFVYGQAGNDFAGGDAGNDKVFGESGNDFLLGNDGNDNLFGGTGSDRAFGQAGNDQVFGEAGNDVGVGGDGNDKLYGGSGRDVLIGGDGLDTLFGGGQDDILIAGPTSHDEDDEALQAILAEWTSNNSYTTRVNNIRNGGGANGAFVLDSATVIDDGLKDTLWGDGGLDWFLFGAGDKLKDKSANELVN